MNTPIVGQINSWAAGLNPEQRAAVVAEGRRVLVLAGAGTGKTRVLAHRVAYLVDQGIDPAEILLLTFTNKAAREMLARVGRLTGLPLHAFTGGTFHHVGNRILRADGAAAGLAEGFRILPSGGAAALMSEVCREGDTAFLKEPGFPRPRNLVLLWSLARARGADADTVYPARGPDGDQAAPPDLHARTGAVLRAYEAAKRERNVVDFDDLVVLPACLLEESASVCERWSERFRHVLVDEFQDTNAVQARLLFSLSGKGALTVVGDDAQSIYSWRGADPQLMHRFAREAGPAGVFKVETNYRSRPEILHLANAVPVNPALEGFPLKVLRSHRGSGPFPVWARLPDMAAQGRYVAERVAEHLEGGGAGGDVAVLFRAHFLALDVQLELARRAVPFRMAGGVPFFGQPHTRLLVDLLSLALSEATGAPLTRCLGHLSGIGEKTGAQLCRAVVGAVGQSGGELDVVMLRPEVMKGVPGVARAGWLAFADTLLAMRRAAAAGPAEAVRAAINGWLGEHVRSVGMDAERYLDDLRMVAGFAGQFANARDLFLRIGPAAGEPEPSGGPTGSRVWLGTLHQAKGLEFKLVFIVGLADGFFPLRRVVEQGKLDEERRLFYVGVTRAMDALHLCWPRAYRAANGSLVPIEPCRFLHDLPTGGLRIVDV